MNLWQKSLLAAVCGTALSVLNPLHAAEVTRAVAVISATEGHKAAGKITFTKEADGIHIVAEISGLEPGTHGFHIHEFGDITGADGMTTGGHFNPTGHKHGAPDAAEHHAGDFGNVEADKTGTAKLDLVVKDLSLDGPNSILGHAIVVHGKPDDLKSQPAGNAGPRVGNGVIGIAKP